MIREINYKVFYSSNSFQRDVTSEWRVSRDPLCSRAASFKVPAQYNEYILHLSSVCRTIQIIYSPHHNKNNVPLGSALVPV